MVVSTGNTRSKASRRPPAKIAMFPVAARWQPPETGQSRNNAPFSARMLAASRAVPALTVDVSATMAPGRAPTTRSVAKAMRRSNSSWPMHLPDGPPHCTAIVRRAPLKGTAVERTADGKLTPLRDDAESLQALVDELVGSFRTKRDLTGPLNFYREFLQNQFSKSERSRLMTEFACPIPVPCTLIWGDKDRFLSEHVAKKSHEQAHCDVEWRPLPGVGHFVSLEAPDRLVAELRTVLAGALTAMVLGNRRVVVRGVSMVPALAEVPDSALANVYVFENGIEGKGPLGFQPDVFDRLFWRRRIGFSFVWHVVPVCESG